MKKEFDMTTLKDREVMFNLCYFGEDKDKPYWGKYLQEIKSRDILCKAVVNYMRYFLIGSDIKYPPYFEELVNEIMASNNADAIYNFSLKALDIIDDANSNDLTKEQKRAVNLTNSKINIKELSEALAKTGDLKLNYNWILSYKESDANIELIKNSKNKVYRKKLKLALEERKDLLLS